MTVALNFTLLLNRSFFEPYWYQEPRPWFRAAAHPRSGTLLSVIPTRGFTHVVTCPPWQVAKSCWGPFLFLLFKSFVSHFVHLNSPSIFCFTAPNCSANIGFSVFINMLAHDPVCDGNISGHEYFKTCIYRPFNAAYSSPPLVVWYNPRSGIASVCPFFFAR